jgi:endonuclease/exonuclease/phosphatase family metal-dependent hydrolase
MNKGVDNLSFQGKTKAEIDHVIFRSTNNVKIKSKSIYLLEEPLVSDHRPIIAELEIIY